MVTYIAQAKTLRASVKRLNREIVPHLGVADVKPKLLNAGGEAVASLPEQLSAAMKSEMARMGKGIKDTGIRVDYTKRLK